MPDCTSCKLIGAGGCFAGAVYALYERSKLPLTNKNRRWLTVIGVGKGLFGGLESVFAIRPCGIDGQSYSIYIHFSIKAASLASMRNLHKLRMLARL